ncbi:hypothetical protein TVAG_166740 [Trichomonas vaginalis G3]|uniref:Uncharacterized protein n=2 Tax=Trichomonas vaginalis (strain ATCC PRA-98 / G3) TaxID=412133 RepID=A2DE81_TRIV3|nr:attachment subunit-related family [Trichomonas vaginalis G3]EAY21299.1 hypothetical protein TVAG_166740 [Trichomonas vaginalis G3]KAI5548963.1 attachment subunit-related family [Trichomonas vaginalis G3]|eukprot:XP_001582285.1 hypothetical protein [Trichomonas vaginalis G3]
MEGRKSVANNSSTTSAVKVPTTYVSPFSKPLRPPIIPKQLPHTIQDNLSNNLSSSSQNTTDTVVQTAPEQVSHSSTIQDKLSNNLSSSSSQNTTETSETDLQPAPEQVSHSSTSMLTRAQFQDLISLEQYSSNETQTDDCNLSLPESIQRKYAMKRLKLLYKLLNNWGVEDNTDYSEMFNKVIESVKPIENDIKNPGVLVDLFASKLPVTTNLIATQAIEQFILCFPKQYRQHLRETRIGKFQLVYPTTYNYYEEANEYGELSFHFTLSVPEGEEKAIYHVQSLAGCEGKPHIITTVAIDKPARVEDDVLFASIAGFGMGEPIPISHFTEYSAQHFQNVEFVFYDHQKFLLTKPKKQFVSIFVAGHVADKEPSDTDYEEEEEEEENDSDVVLIE